MEPKKVRLSQDVTRIIFVRNLPYKSSSDELYELFGKFGTIRQIRKGTQNDTKGTAFVIYDDIFEAKEAFDSLSGYNYQGRYLTMQYYNQQKWELRKTQDQEKKDMENLRKKWNVDTTVPT